MLAERRVGDDRGVAVGAAPSTGSSGCSRRAPPPLRPAELVEEALQVARVSAPAAVEDLVELDGRGGLVDRDRVAVVQPAPTASPGCTSTKKLPSRKMRGRIFSVASRWIGRPLRSIRIVTTAACAPSSAWAILVTLPTLTPGDPHRRVRADVVRRREDGRDREVVAERDRLREAEVEDDGDDRERRARPRRTRSSGRCCGDGGASRLPPFGTSTPWPPGAAVKVSPSGHARRAEADALAVAVELLEGRAERAVDGGAVDGRAAVRVARDPFAGTGCRPSCSRSGRRRSSRGPASSTARAVEGSRGGPGAPCAGRARPGRGRTRWRPIVADRVAARRAEAGVQQRALRAAGVVGRREVLGRDRPEVVPVVADRDVRAEEAELRRDACRSSPAGRAATRSSPAPSTRPSSASSACCSGSSSCVIRALHRRRRRRARG